MKRLHKVFGTAAASLALFAMSGTASALTYQGSDFYSSVSGAGTNWTLTLFMDFSTPDAGNEFIGDNMEAWSLTLPESATVSTSDGDFSGWYLGNNAQADATGCGGGAVPAICADWDDPNILNGGGPLISSGSMFAFTVDLLFANAVDLTDWIGNFHLLTVREFTRGCGQAESCIKKDGGLISEPLTSVPEPGTLALLGLGLLGVGLSRRRRA